MKENLKVLSKVRLKKMVLVFLVLFAVSPLVFAENVPAQDPVISIGKTVIDSKSMGFYISAPAYLYSKYSASGLQGGYQFKNVNLRLDLSVVNDYENGLNILYAMPSFGIFFSEDFQSLIRVYQGIAIGGEFGIKDAFEGQAYFINFLVGAEFLSFGKNTFFIEFGPGLGISSKDGAYNGGTVIGGGVRIFF